MSVFGSTVAPGGAPSPEARARRSTRTLWLVLALCAAPVLASYALYYGVRPGMRSNYAPLIEPPRELPGDLPLRDLDGRAVAPAALGGQWLLLVAGPSPCSPACERILLLQRQLREMMGKERERIDKVWLVTDEAPLDARLVDALRGEPAVQVLRAPATAVQRWLGQPGTAGLDFVIVDPQRMAMMRVPDPAEPARLKRDLDRLLRASASWDRPGR